MSQEESNFTLKSDSRQFHHVLVIEAPKFRRTVVLQATNYSVGRHRSNSIVIDSEFVSRYHATLLCIKSTENNDYSFCIIDGNLNGHRSQNGIYVNSKRQLSKKLQHGDYIYFGQVQAKYYIIHDQAFDMIAEDEFEEKHTWETEAKNKAITLIASGQKPEELNNSDLVRLASFPELSPNPIIEIDINGEITYLNPAALMKFKDIYQAKLEHPILAGLTANCQNQNGSLFVREIKIEPKVFEQYIHYLPESKLIRSYIFDITERKRSEEMLHYQAFHDLLTDLPNRKLFNDQLSTALVNARRNQNPMAVMFLDIDRFKNINDSLGHAIGDQLLQGFAKRLKSCLRSGDTVARWGGDEFTVLLPQISSAEDVAKLGKRILDSLKPAFKLEEYELYIRSSIGIAIYPQDGKDASTLLKNADAALYRAKERGRNNYQFYNPAINSQACVSLRLENLLYQALEREEFLVYYQPQVNIETGNICGVESLLRWQHPTLGLISPGQFISLAEETDLIILMDEWVLKTACAQNRAWQKAGLPPLRVAVNLSPREFQQNNLVAMVARVLDETGLDPQFLELEITETTIMQDVDLTLEILLDLVQMGVHISMDDFGTGYSCLSYLKKFPFHTLKIDQSFVQDLRDDLQNKAIISAVIALGRALNLRVIAEGVETPQQLELLQSLQCEEMQGYLFSKPLPVEDFTKFQQTRLLR
ncbi:MAG: EAL domain-containing protein [Xenococcaceae cyanobacterium]